VSHTARVHMTSSATVFLSLLCLWGAAASVHGQGIEWETLTDQAQSLYQQGQYHRAVVVAQQALDIAEKAVGPNHPSVAASLSNLAVLYHVQGQYVQAEPLYKRALAIREKALGPEHPDVATSLENIAGLYRKTGRDTEAEPLEKRAQAIRGIVR
jgi:tetratricopeptide (TPR) repeat protein